MCYQPKVLQHKRVTTQRCHNLEASPPKRVTTKRFGHISMCYSEVKIEISIDSENQEDNDLDSSRSSYCLLRPLTKE